MDKIDFRNNSVESLERFLFKDGFNRIRINNFKNAFKNQKINSLTELKKTNDKKKLFNILPFSQLEFINSVKDNNGNEKFIFKTSDANYIESVYMPKENSSICVSVQAGCRFSCAICATGEIGYKRNLFTHEILEQIRFIYLERLYPKRLSCVSFMGMGEPFDNLKNSMNAFEWIASSWGWQIGRYKINFSTSGTIPFNKFLKFENLPNLAVSLHSADEKKRRMIIPKTKISLDQLKKNMLQYTKKTGILITIEYCLLKYFNDSKKDALQLTDYLTDLPCKVNLLNYNNTANNKFMPVSETEIKFFKSILTENKIKVIYRKSLGAEVGAGCGQLCGKYNEKY